MPIVGNPGKKLHGIRRALLSPVGDSSVLEFENSRIQGGGGHEALLVGLFWGGGAGDRVAPMDRGSTLGLDPLPCGRCSEKPAPPFRSGF